MRNVFRRGMSAVAILGVVGTLNAAEIETAGELFVDLRAADPSSATGIWKNRGSLGDFEAVGQPQPTEIDGVPAVMLNAGESNDAWRCRDMTPAGLVGQSPTRSVEVWVYNPEVGFEEPMVAWSRRGGPPGTAFGFNYGDAPGHGALTHWGGADLGWGQVPTAGTWHHLVHTFDGRTNRVYSDSREVAREVLRPTDVQSHAGSRITLGTGIRADHEPEFGTIRASLALAIVRVHDGVLSPEQILNNYLVDGARLGLTEDPGQLRYTGTPAREAFAYIDGRLVYTADVEVRGLPLPRVEALAPAGATLERLTPERHRLTWTLPAETPRRIDVRVIARNSQMEVPAAWSVRVAPLRFRPRMLAVDTNECCDVADIDNDGRLDVIAGRAWYAAPEFVPRPLRAIGEFGKDYSANNGDHAFDVNGDGWVDVIAGSFKEPEVFWFENPGREGLDFGRQWKVHLMTDTQQIENELSFFRDLDQDGVPEFVVNSWNPDRAMLAWKLRARGDAVGLDKLEFGPAGPRRNGHGMGFGDINGDGLEDIVFESGWYERPPTDALQMHWRLHADWHYPGSSCPILVQDLNNDGRNDMILGRGHDYGLLWFEQLEPSADGKTRWQDHVIDASFSQSHALHWVDLDGDGVGELVTGKRVRAHSGSDPGANDAPEMFFYRWDEQRRLFTRYTISSGRVGTGLQIRDGDMNGDGLTDLVVAGKSGTFVLSNLGPPETESPQTPPTGLALEDGDRVVFVGSGWVERAQRFGQIETALTGAFPRKRIEFRNLGWVGDTVFGHARAPGRTGSTFGDAEEGFANLVKQVRDAKPTVLIVGYGVNESFDDDAGLAAFRGGAARLLDELSTITTRMLVVSPHGPGADDAERHRRVTQYARILEEEVTRRQLSYLSLLDLANDPRAPLTSRFGMAFTDAGYAAVARAIADRFSVGPRSWAISLRGRQVVGERGLEVLAVRETGTGLHVAFRGERLAMPGDTIELEFQALAAGTYRLSFDGVVVRTLDMSDSVQSCTIAAEGQDDHPLSADWQALRAAVVRKNRLFFHSWRPRNTAFITGERKSEQVPSHGDVPLFIPLVVEQERHIARLKHPRTHTIELVRID